MWDTQADYIRGALGMQDNKGVFTFVSLAGHRVEANIRFNVGKDGDLDMSSRFDLTQEKEKLRLLLEEGHALFMPTRTAAGTAITPSTPMSALTRAARPRRCSQL